MKLGADRIDVSVVVPAFNEADGLPRSSRRSTGCSRR
jgi:hypothetical protein